MLSAVPLLVLSHDDAGSCWRVSLRFASDLAALEPLAYLKPFLGVIRSEETSGPITGVALSSVNKFLSYGFIRTHTRTLTRTRALFVALRGVCIWVNDEQSIDRRWPPTSHAHAPISK
jgi:hypothetical protein